MNTGGIIAIIIVIIAVIVGIILTILYFTNTYPFCNDISEKCEKAEECCGGDKNDCINEKCCGLKDNDCTKDAECCSALKCVGKKCVKDPNNNDPNNNDPNNNDLDTGEYMCQGLQAMSDRTVGGKGSNILANGKKCEDINNDFTMSRTRSSQDRNALCNSWYVKSGNDNIQCIRDPNNDNKCKSTDKKCIDESPRRDFKRSIGESSWHALGYYSDGRGGKRKPQLNKEHNSEDDVQKHKCGYNLSKLPPEIQQCKNINKSSLSLYSEVGHENHKYETWNDLCFSYYYVNDNGENIQCYPTKDWDHGENNGGENGCKDGNKCII